MIYFTEEEMIDFAWWLTENIGQYNDDYLANLNGKYLEQWLNKNKNDNTNKK